MFESWTWAVRTATALPLSWPEEESLEQDLLGGVGMKMNTPLPSQLKLEGLKVTKLESENVGVRQRRT